MRIYNCTVVEFVSHLSGGDCIVKKDGKNIIVRYDELNDINDICTEELANAMKLLEDERDDLNRRVNEMNEKCRHMYEELFRRAFGIDGK